MWNKLIVSFYFFRCFLPLLIITTEWTGVQSSAILMYHKVQTEAYWYISIMMQLLFNMGMQVIFSHRMPISLCTQCNTVWLGALLKLICWIRSLEHTHCGKVTICRPTCIVNKANDLFSFLFTLPDTPELPQQGGMILPDGTDLRQVTVLSKAEWDRIERELNRRQIEEERVRRIRKEHEEQKQKSRELVKSWGNTLHVRLIFMCLCQIGEGVNKLGTCIVSYTCISLPLSLASRM